MSYIFGPRYIYNDISRYRTLIHTENHATTSNTELVGVKLHLQSKSRQGTEELHVLLRKGVG